MTRRSLPVFVALIGALFAWMVAGCGDIYSTVDQDEASNDSKKMYLSCSPDNININGGGSITVLVQVLYANDSPVADSDVLVTATLGTLSASSIITDSEGVASAALTPGEEAGTAVVVATHGTLQTQCQVAFYETGDDASGN